jgi:hypothetical protein
VSVQCGTSVKLILASLTVNYSPTPAPTGSGIAGGSGASGSSSTVTIAASAVIVVVALVGTVVVGGLVRKRSKRASAVERTSEVELEEDSEDTDEHAQSSTRRLSFHQSWSTFGVFESPVATRPDAASASSAISPWSLQVWRHRIDRWLGVVSSRHVTCDEDEIDVAIEDDILTPEFVVRGSALFFFPNGRGPDGVCRRSS